MAAIIDAAIFAIAFWGLPSTIDSPTDGEGAADLTWERKWAQLREDIDWVGAIIASISLAMLSYVFAYAHPVRFHRHFTNNFAVR